MMQTFFIKGRLPGLNDMLASARASRGKWQKFAEEKVLYQSMIRADIKQAKLKRVTGPVSVHLVWVEPNAKRDYDNIRAGVKFILDALVAQKILQDDTRKQVIGFHDSFSVDKHTPGVWVTLEYL